MSEPRIRALVLAAGEGVRLRPLTQITPKPLLPVAGDPILAHTLRYLALAGVEVAAINLHHLGSKIRERLGSQHGIMPLVYSTEEELLGTLGALVPLKYVFEPADLVVVVNGDSLCRWPVARVIETHLKTGAAATLLTTDKPALDDFGGGVGIDAKGHVVSFQSRRDFGQVARRTVFAGFHVFSPRLLDRVEGGPADFIRDLYEPLLTEGGILKAVTTNRDWHDLGTPRRYLEGVLDWTQCRPAGRLPRARTFVAPGVHVHPTARLLTSVVEQDVEIGFGARVDKSLILPGAKIGRESDIADAIIGFGVELPPGTRVERCLVNTRVAGYSAGPRDSMIGDLVYTPLDRNERKEPT